MAPAKVVRFQVDQPIANNGSSLHYIPAKVEWNQEANVDTRFNNFINDENGVLQVEFRGRPLNGAQIELPRNFKGFICENGNGGTPGKNRGVHRLTSEFSNYTYWNWDRKPSGMDTHVKLQDWLHLSEILHSPIAAEEVNDG